jgi:hypothetical protein
MINNEKLLNSIVIFLILFIVIKTINVNINNILISAAIILGVMYYNNIIDLKSFKFNDLKETNITPLANLGTQFLQKKENEDTVNDYRALELLEKINYFKVYNPETFDVLKYKIYEFFKTYNNISPNMNFRYEYLDNLNLLYKEILNNLASIIINIPIDQNIENKLKNLIGFIDENLRQYINDYKKNPINNINSSSGLFNIDDPEAFNSNINKNFDVY